MAVRYAEFARDPANTAAPARGILRSFAELVLAHGGGAGVLDAGCGPGHLTATLADLGVAARGIDLSPVAIRLAREARPDLVFEVGSFFALGFEDDRFDGVLAHFSLIHTPPADLPAALAELVRVLRPGGVLLVGFQTGGDEIGPSEPFDHKVSPAYRWPVDAMAALLGAHGVSEIARLVVRAGPHNRFPEGYLLARLGPGEPS